MNETNINETVETIEEKADAPAIPEQPQEQSEEPQKGLSENAKEWIKDITGREFTPVDFLDYLEEKYSAIYEL